VSARCRPLIALVAVSMNVTELEPIETSTSVRSSGEKAIPCTSSWSRYSVLSAPGTGSPTRMTSSSLLELGSITETVFEVWLDPSRLETASISSLPAATSFS